MFEYSLERLDLGDTIEKGQILYKPGILFNRASTQFFRSDLNWVEFGKYLREKFKDDKKVNTYVYACANGSEPYSLSLLLQSEFPSYCEKFFPICAKDIDKKLINQNIADKARGQVKAGVVYPWIKYGLQMEDDMIDECLLIKEGDIPEDDEEWLLEKVIAPVEFQYANILNDVKNIDSEHPSILMARNMWPYVRPFEYQDFSDELYKRLAKGSVVVVGDYDYRGQKGFVDSDKFPSCLIKSGFKPVRFQDTAPGKELVFEKV